eukprot:CAMPEP_0174252598 /NCGR_PEP_ID=MMETSP0439-20130205/2000_1 /TAXON_ID=0 /ORGANISM="Stereomyxa ramosa, Strain Chinc5" /LENGTH=862 /DNA_ID=CAMNT_0015333157 /DNA_START=1619 /DNA_END=4204 /DNA_ORIENTATION=-
MPLRAFERCFAVAVFPLTVAWNITWNILLLLWGFVGPFLTPLCKRWLPDFYWAATRKVPQNTDYNEIKNAVLQSKVVREAIGLKKSKKRRASLRKSPRPRPTNGSTKGHYEPQDQNATVREKDRSKEGSELDPARLAEAERIISTMAARPRVVPIRVLGYIFRKIWRMLYPFGFHVCEEDINAVRERMKKGPVLWLPTHKSHVDYLIMTHLCFSNDLLIPYVVAGDNLNITMLGTILRWGGAFFIRRSFSGERDNLYSVIFGEYIKQLIARGHSLECFIEGGRSRSGKVLPPKTGMLQRVVEGILDGDFEDIHLVPISIAYDRLVENESHIEELAGRKKQKERFRTVVSRLSKVLMDLLFNVTCYGRVDIRIADPFSLKEYITEVVTMSQIPSLRLGNSDYVKLVPTETLSRKQIAYYAGFKALCECNRVSVVEPAAVVATVMLTHYQRGITKSNLLKESNWICAQISERGGTVVPIDNDILDAVVEYVLEGIMDNNKLVKKHNDMFMLSLYNPRERLELSVYRNQLLHYFVEEGIIACCIYASEKSQYMHSRTSKSPQKFPDASMKAISIHEEELLRSCIFLARLLKLEFMYRPAPGKKSFESTFQYTIDTMVSRNVLVYIENEPPSMNGYTDDAENGTTPQRTIIHHNEDEELIDISDSQQHKENGHMNGKQKTVRKSRCKKGKKKYDSDALIMVNEAPDENGNSKGTEEYLFLCSLFWHFIDSYWLAFLGFFFLLPAKTMREHKLLKKTQRLGERLYFEGQIDLYEAIGKETLINAITLFKNWKVLEFIFIEGQTAETRPGNRIVRLLHDYQSPEALIAMVKQIGWYRKRSRAYRSRRNLIKRGTATSDAIKMARLLSG